MSCQGSDRVMIGWRRRFVATATAAIAGDGALRWLDADKAQDIVDTNFDAADCALRWVHEA